MHTRTLTPAPDIPGSCHLSGPPGAASGDPPGVPSLPAFRLLGLHPRHPLPLPLYLRNERLWRGPSGPPLPRGRDAPPRIDPRQPPSELLPSSRGGGEERRRGRGAARALGKRRGGKQRACAPPRVRVRMRTPASRPRAAAAAAVAAGAADFSSAARSVGDSPGRCSSAAELPALTLLPPAPLQRPDRRRRRRGARPRSRTRTRMRFCALASFGRRQRNVQGSGPGAARGGSVLVFCPPQARPRRPRPATL